MGESCGDGVIDVRVYYKFLVILIWIGCVIMVFGVVFFMVDCCLCVGVFKLVVKWKKML